MPWNWQQPDWPQFQWNASRLAAAEQRFLVGSGVNAGIAQHLAQPDREQLFVHALTSEALTTSEIEGEILDRESVQSSLRKQLGLAFDKKRARPAEEGIAEMMVDVYRSFDAPLTEGVLFRWHQMLTKGRRDLRDVGAFRTGKDPMQVVSGAIHAPKVHFEAPPARQVPREMARFLRWFERTGPGGKGALPPVTRAGIAHLYFESIHPFEDGNGRLGRAVSEKALAQALGQASITGLAAAILARRKEYYAALEKANQGNEITAWLAFFAGITLEAQQRATATVEFLIDKARLLDSLTNKLNARQRKVLLRMFREGPAGFAGGLSAGNYATIGGASPATATRDLADMVEKGALTRSGEQRYTRYQVAVRLRNVGRVTITAGGEVKEEQSTAN